MTHEQHQKFCDALNAIETAQNLCFDACRHLDAHILGDGTLPRDFYQHQHKVVALGRELKTLWHGLNKFRQSNHAGAGPRPGMEVGDVVDVVKGGQQG